MAVRHWILRLSVRTCSSSHHFKSLSGIFREPFCGQQQALSPAIQEFARSISSTNFSAGFMEARAGNNANGVYEYHRLISALNYKRRSKLARDVYEDMLLDGVQPIRDTFYLLISGCMRDSRLQDVIYFFEEMKAMGLSPDASMYNYVIAACGRCIQVNRAFQIAEEMEASGIQPKQRTFLTLLRCCAIAGRVDEAYGIVRRMAASGFTLDKHFYSALITAHRNKKPYTKETVDKIFELLEQSKQSLVEDPMASAATGEFEVTDEDSDVLNFLVDDAPTRRGVFIDRRLAVYHSAVSALTALGNKEAVKAVLQLMQQDGQEPDAYCIIQLIKCYLSEGDLERACAEYNKYLELGKMPTLDLFIILIEGAISACSPSGSAVAHKLLIELGNKGFFLNGQIGTQLLIQACEAKTPDITVASLIWDMLKNREVKLPKGIIQVYCRFLERNNVPKDDPRYIAVKVLVDDRWKANFKVWKDFRQTPDSEQVSAERSEQVVDVGMGESSAGIGSGIKILDVSPSAGEVK